MNDAVVIVGTGMAGLVTAHGLGRTGRPVVLVGSRRRAGGHFAGLEVEGQAFDLGMVFLEFASFRADPAAALLTYDETRLGDSGRLVAIVERFIRELGIRWRQAVPPQMLLAGKVLGDLVLANQLAALQDLPEALRGQLLDQLRGQTRACPAELHASRKASWPARLSHNLRRVSLANHGEILHELLIEPLCRKFANVGSDSLVGKFHRSLWAPLYYPETLVSVLEGQPSPFEASPFHYPEGDKGFRVFPERLVQEIDALPAVVWHEAEPVAVTKQAGGQQLTLDSGLELRARQFVWSAAPEKLLECAGSPPGEKLERSSLGLVFALVRPDDLDSTFSAIHLLDDDGLFARITCQSGSANAPLQKLVGEFNLDCAAQRGCGRDEDVVESFTGMLERLGLLRPGRRPLQVILRPFRDALPLTTEKNLALHEERRQQLRERFPDFVLVGASAPYGASSFNDQILQGLKAAALLS